MNEDNAVCYNFPVVYYCHVDGFIVSCQMSWGQRCEEVKKPDFEETSEVLGVGGDHICTRTYSVISYQVDSEGYRRVTLYCNLCNNATNTFFLHHLCLITFRGKRPRGCVGHHLGGNSDNNIKKLMWIPPSENSLLRNIHRDN